MRHNTDRVPEEPSAESERTERTEVKPGVFR